MQNSYELLWAKPISTSESIGYDWDGIASVHEECLLFCLCCVCNVKKFIEWIYFCRNTLSLWPVSEWRKEITPVHLLFCVLHIWAKYNILCLLKIRILCKVFFWNISHVFIIWNVLRLNVAVNVKHLDLCRMTALHEPEIFCTVHS